MIVRIEAMARKFRRLFSRSEWVIHLLNLSAAKDKEMKQGLVMIQIDGLGLTQLNRAIEKGRMPFLASLSKKENYRLYQHYTGLPSNTPAVQGALFYGVKTCVPAFSFRDHNTGVIFNMFNPESALAVENEIKEKGEPLLARGSSYGNIFTGGAAEPHFCVSSIGWGSFFKAALPLGVPLTILLNLHVFISTLFFIIVESVLSIVDFIKAIFSGKKIIYEINFIPFRIAVCVLLRDIIAAGSKIDIARGLPVVHVNFAGYDEQSHHRGPASAFAHRSLKGIDTAIKDIWYAANASRQREYTVFVYSDHGQEETVPYEDEYGKTIQDAVAEVFKEKIQSDQWNMEFSSYGAFRRSDLLRNKPKKMRIAPLLNKTDANSTISRVDVAALGSVGHIYPPHPLSAEEKDIIALKLVDSAKIPVVMIHGDAGKMIVYNQTGKFIFPDEAERLIEPNHPFFKQIQRDLYDLCCHPNAGEFIFLGLRKGQKTITFHTEHGTHVGPGVEETSGFALLPIGTILKESKSTITTEDLRQAAFRAQEREDQNSSGVEECIVPIVQSTLRVMTYNVHSCMGRDGKISPARIARIIARHNPDVIALQELSTNDECSQAQLIAKKLSMSFQFHPCLSVKHGRRGNAILSKFPTRLIREGFLPKLSGTPFLESRGALWVELDMGVKKVQVINTHLSLSSRERQLQINALVGPDWVGSALKQGPVVFCGDFNALAQSQICQTVELVLKNTHFDLAGHRPLKTLPSFYPISLVDHIFVSGSVKTTAIQVPNSGLEKVASDHLPLIVEIEVG